MLLVLRSLLPWQRCSLRLRRLLLRLRPGPLLLRTCLRPRCLLQLQLPSPCLERFEWTCLWRPRLQVRLRLRLDMRPVAGLQLLYLAQCFRSACPPRRCLRL